MDHGLIYKYHFYSNLALGGGFAGRREHRNLNVSLHLGKYSRLMDLDNTHFDLILECGAGYHSVSREWMQIDNNDYRINRRDFYEDRIRVYPVARGFYLMPAFGFMFGFKDDLGDDFMLFEFKYHLMNFRNQSLGIRFGEIDFEGELQSTRVAASDSRLDFNMQNDQFFSKISWFTIGVRFVIFN